MANPISVNVSSQAVGEEQWKNGGAGRWLGRTLLWGERVIGRPPSYTGCVFIKLVCYLRREKTNSMSLSSVTSTGEVA